MKCNHCGGEMEWKENEDILIPVGDDEDKMNYQKILDEFIEIEKKRVRVGSGDDGAWEEQIVDYINKQRKFWIDFMKFMEEKLYLKVQKK